MTRWTLLLIITAFPTGCSDSPSGPDPNLASVSASVSAPSQAYTNIDEVALQASCSSSDGLSEITLIYESPDPSESFTRNPTPSGNSFSETVTNKYEEEGTASLEVLCMSTEDVKGSDKASTALVAYETQLDLELRNNATGQLQEGFVYAGDDSIHTSDGNLDLILNDPSITSIRLGLIDEDGEFGSYLRKIEISAGQRNSSSEYMVDFKFRNPRTNQIIGELVKTGYNYNGPMDITRFLGHLDENILVNGVVPRWDELNRVAFADTASSQEFDYFFYFQVKSEADLLFETYKQQWEDIIQPHLLEDVPFQRVDHFVYNSEADVDSIIAVRPNPNLKDRNRLGEIGLFRDGTTTNAGASIFARDKLPSKDTNRPNYDALLYRTGFHELYSALINTGRSSKHTRTDESILTLNSTLRNEISPIDSKVLGELSQSRYIGDTEKASEYLVLPPGF